MADTILLVTALWVSFSLRLGEWYLPTDIRIVILVLIAPAIAIPVFVRYGLYRAIIRYLGMRAAWSVTQAVALYAVLWGLAALLSGVPDIPRSVVLINAMVALLAVGGSRALMRWLLSIESSVEEGEEPAADKKRVVIFGVEDAGRQLAVGLTHSRDYILCGFIDDTTELLGREMIGVPVLSLEQLPIFSRQHRITDLLLAIPSASREERNQILEQVRPLPLRVRTLPGLDALAKGEVDLNDLHDLEIEDLLAREPACPDEALLQQQVRGQVILVTGAGGSIGGEICRQVLRRKPKVLLLYELSEYALYTIYNELLTLLNKLLSGKVPSKEGIALVPRIIPLLGSVQDEQRLTELMQTWKPSMIYHAAAYKHVPMVESNVAEGIKNNVLGTLTVVKSAIEHKVGNVVLISTDKAVRPTNTMGCSKRVAEMVLQALAEKRELIFESLNMPPLHVVRKTHLSMVRFGNVLGSSGSVVPLFHKQIRQGGPITLTHKDIIRYFMTIPEAAQLVMQAGAMATESRTAEVFVLDMGEPVRIGDLARRMVELSGYRIKDKDNPEGDIEILVTGLRPGEKLYEELLIGNAPLETDHPRIMKAQEEFMSWEQLQPQLYALMVAAENSDVELVRSILKRLVPGYEPEDHVVDWVYAEQLDR